MKYFKKASVLCLAVLLLSALGILCGAEAEQRVYLTVSEITFSYVGQSESIYCGTVPVNQVLWSSDDPEIVDVVSGILIAESGSTALTRAFT